MNIQNCIGDLKENREKNICILKVTHHFTSNNIPTLNPNISKKEQNKSVHPWEKDIKEAYLATYKYGHNTARNPIIYPPAKVPHEIDKVPDKNRVKLTVIGNRVTKEFIYCMKLVKGLHKYRSKNFDVPDIRAVTSVEWPKVWNDLKIQFGGTAYCLKSQVAVLMNGQFLGGDKDLKEFIESRYVFYLKPDYYNEAVKLFCDFVTSSGRPCAYFQVSIDEEKIGTMIFMLYSDIVPRTCENFLRLCKEKKAGYSGTPVHRIVKDSWIQCGGFGLKDSGLDCENFIVPHDQRGVLGMANDGRHVDCSTQFFVLLQPQPWMAFKYVAFGQLISGEETLKRIEEVPTWYESPSKKIVFYNTGILNLDCQNIAINKNTTKYLEGHIENLYELGELFIRNKEEITTQLERTRDERSPSVQSSENNFDADNFEYDPEEYSYKQASKLLSSSEKVKPDQPYYLPFTDVPYIGDVDSDFNLRRLLQGDYCLESDLDKEVDKKKTIQSKYNIFTFPSEMCEAFETPPTEPGSRESLDSEQQWEIQNYLKSNADRFSFAGSVIKAVAKKGKFNLFELQKQSDTITDEILRKYKMVEEEFRAHQGNAFGHHKEIKRRNTGFVRPADMAKLIKSHSDVSEEEDEEDDLDDYLPYTRQMRIIQATKSADADTKAKTQEKLLKERQTDLDRKDDLDKLHIDHKKDDAEEGDGAQDEDVKESKSVRVDELPEKKFQGLAKISFRDQDVSRASRSKARFSQNEDIGDRPQRPSLIERILEASTTSNDLGPPPTLKEYKPFFETQIKKNNSLFLTHTSPSRQLLTNDESRENYLKRHSLSIDIPQKSIDQVLLLQHGQKVYRKISSDYVRTIDNIEQKQENSLRSLEYARQRPAISVKDYQKMNQEYHAKAKEDASRAAIDKSDEAKIISALQSGTSRQTSQFESGLRLPGDTPLFQSLTEDKRGNTAGNNVV
ncbi:hypothetical protein HW555_002821 [Spodoptera exigua]|uniref:PPIase cyclophilin-type domain-containing protein n=1 Tax=Spodoptera exigua TaxID=7107 RepID=A0A835L7K6_SPOEX|nr:hypothetical protein HW555_002821 [Spodoptera exigua]